MARTWSLLTVVNSLRRTINEMLTKTFNIARVFKKKLVTLFGGRRRMLILSIIVLRSVKKKNKEWVHGYRPA